MPQKVLEYYSVNSSHTVETALYIPRLDAAEEESADLIEILAWQCAANTLQALGKTKEAEEALKKVNEFILTNTY